MSATPLHSPNEKMMKCCDKATSKDHSPAAEAARLCCAVSCSESTPTTSGFASSFAPSGAAISSSIAEQIATLFTSEDPQRDVSPAYLREIPPQPFQPTYIRHRALLI